MKFEEILPLIKQGKKAKCLSYDFDGEYWTICHRSVVGSDENFKTIARIDKDGFVRNNANSWGIPRHIIMQDDWELID